MANMDKKWDRVNKVLGKEREATQEDLARAVSVRKEQLEEADGIIAQYKQKKIQRTAAIEAMKQWNKAQLEVLKEQLSLTVEVKKKEAHIDAEKYLAQIDQKHIHFLNELDFKNMEQRMKMFHDLNKITAEWLHKIDSSDVPEKLVDESIENIYQLRSRFIDKIMAD